MTKWVNRAGFLLCAALAALLLLAGVRVNSAGFGLYSWDEDALEAGGEAEALAACIKEAGVKRVYQEFSKESLEDGAAEAFVKRLKKQSVEVFALFGAEEWARDKKGETVIKTMRRVARYNEGKSRSARITGVMVDVEPYLLDEWDEGSRARRKLMENYLSSMEAAYAYAEEHDLELWLCIPNFYDTGFEDILESLISDACDGIAVMNYNRTDEYMQIAKEVGLAREYGKGVECIFELQEPHQHELEEINTYAGVGLDALWRSAARLEKQFGYDRLRFAYHYYRPLQQMLAEK